MAQNHLRIGMVCYPTYGGSGAVAAELGQHLARRGHTIHFISYARPFRLGNVFDENIIHHEINSEHYPVLPGQLYTISAAVRIRDIIHDQGLDLLHVHYALPHAVSAALAMDMLGPAERVPTVTTLHGTDITLVGSKPSFAPAVKLGLERSDAITCVSQWLAARTCELFDICNRVEVINNFVDPDVFRPRASRCRRERFATADERILMHISNFRPVKRVLDVIETFHRIAQRTPARLIMIGDGPEREAAQMRAVQLGIADRILMLGKQAEVESFLPIADLFLFPSENESFGLAALEAMACGTPVLGARSGGLVEVVEDGVSGRLCPLGDVDAMAEAGLDLLSDENLRSGMGRAARRQAHEKFAADRIIPRYENLYGRLLGK